MSEKRDMKDVKMTVSKRKNRRLPERILFIALLYIFIPAGCDEELTITEPGGRPKPSEMKGKAEQILRNALTDTNPQIRAKAVEVVATTGEKMMMPQVQKLLLDEYVPVRFAAAVAIGDMEYYLAKSTLERLLKAPDENTKLGAAYALYKLGYKQHLEPICQAVLSNDQTVRANAVVLLGKSGEPDVLKLLYWAKDNDRSEPKVRYQAAEAISRLGDEEIIPKLWTLLISKFVENKLIGIRAMGALGTIEAKEILLTKLDDDILEVRLAAAEQLGMLGNTSGQDRVISVFEDNLTEGLDQDGYERVMVLTALAIGRINTPAVRKYLPELIEDDSKLVRLAAAQAVLLSENVR